MCVDFGCFTVVLLSLFTASPLIVSFVKGIHYRFCRVKV